MEKRTSAIARILAVLALAGAVVILIVVIAGAVGGSGSSSQTQFGGHRHGTKDRHRTDAATYEVKSGDTLISISHQTWVPVHEIEVLNPEIDPQILIAGEKLKLR